MKYPCAIIRDILPCIRTRYAARRRAAVEEHLSECADCAEYYGRLADDSGNISVPEIENRKADSLRAVSRRVRRKTAAIIILAAALLLVCLLGGVATTMMGKKRVIDYDGGNITVSMRPEGLVASVRGTRYSGARVKTVFIDDDGGERLLKIVRLEESEWDALATGKNAVMDFTIAYADKDADIVEAVYYYGGDIADDRFKGMEELSEEERDRLLGEMTLLWKRY